MPRADILLAVGVSLVMAGLFFRGFAASARRDLARRKEHRVDERKTRDASLSREFDRPPGWFERNLGVIANAILVIGVIISVLGFMRR